MMNDAFTLAATNRALAEIEKRYDKAALELIRIRSENEKLRRFFHAAIDAARAGLGMDGLTIQELALESGLAHIEPSGDSGDDICIIDLKS